MAPPRYGTTSTGEPPPAKPPRYGTTSCALAKATGNTGRVVAVEPDPAAQAHLVANLRRNGCSVGVVRGTVGASSPLEVVSKFGPTRAFHEVCSLSALFTSLHLAAEVLADSGRSCDHDRT